VADLRGLRDLYALERPHWERVAKATKQQLQIAVRQARIGAANVTCRCKEIPSLLRKAILKERVHRLGEIRDKAGARVTVTSEDHIDVVVARIQDGTELDVREVENTADRYDPNVFDYRGVHLDVILPRSLVPEVPGTVGDLWCEVQVRTQAQTLWADTAHPLIYKGAIEPPDSTKRSIHRLMALVELYDLEVRRARKVIAEAPGYAAGRVNLELERLFYSLAAGEPDPETSQIIIEALLPLYGSASTDEIVESLEGFVEEQRERLLWTYDHYASDNDRALLFLPESIMIFERLEADRHLLMDRWQRQLAPDLLEEMAEAWRVPY
jgi:ppGpp synthetase/RelA/SpoT-type nucleotidyltranferase